MSYGTVINGGAQMRKGVSKGINDKLTAHAGEDSRREVIAGAVRKAFTVRNLSDQTTNNSNKGKFKTPSVPSKV